MRDMLEEPPLEGESMGYRPWVATEWIIRGRPSLFEIMAMESEIELVGWKTGMLQAGPLYNGKGIFYQERWAFEDKSWRKYRSMLRNLSRRLLPTPSQRWKTCKGRKPF
ncbi:hypothetical protein F4775DRAFT_574582 [Biscogniauxia sp. FL1348]|nr:hypothetical protein F4775DRAFT_574582 [Biscogniauxia sp. FL1348]